VIRLALEDPRWLDFVERRASASFFHHPIWARLVADCYGYDAMALAVTNASTAIEAGLPVVEVRTPLHKRRWVALPFTDYCPALGEGDAVGALATEIADEAHVRAIGGIEVRGAPPSANHPSRVVAVRHTVDLTPSVQAVGARLSQMHRRNIRKAERSHVTVARGTAGADIESFYRLHLRTRRRHGVPIQPRRFFDLLQRRVIEAGHGFLITASLDGRPIASAVFLAWKETLIYKYGASDERFWDHRANNLVLWSAIEWACANRYRTLDLGRSDLEDVGLRAWKAGWSAREEPLIHWGTALADRGGMPVLERGMAALIRRGHPWFTRAVGELLYRYAA
jgi:CelD/BcsL family acetyltransferase involved in cellulose biosynthesis